MYPFTLGYILLKALVPLELVIKELPLAVEAKSNTF